MSDFTLWQLMASDFGQAWWNVLRWLHIREPFGQYSHGKSAWRMLLSALARPYWYVAIWLRGIRNRHIVERELAATKALLLAFVEETRFTKRLADQSKALMEIAKKLRAAVVANT